MDLATLAPAPDSPAADDTLSPSHSGVGTAIAGMTRARRERATIAIARKLREAEDKLDDAGIALAELLMTSLQARKDAKISATFGDDLAVAQTEALRTWSQSRSQTVGWHKQALRYAGVLGTRIVAEGDTDRPNV